VHNVYFWHGLLSGLWRGENSTNTLKNCAKTATKITVRPASELAEFLHVCRGYLALYTNRARPPERLLPPATGIFLCLHEVQNLAGHASLAMTQRYREGDTDAKRRLIVLMCVSTCGGCLGGEQEPSPSSPRRVPRTRYGVRTVCR
jgi:hypothetical protein